MKLFKSSKRLAVVGLALTVAILGGGAAFAYFTTSGTGSGVAVVASAQSVSINQLAPTTQVGYNSIVPSPDTWSLSYEATGTTDFGNKINLATSAPLSNVVVALDSQACQTGSGTGCVTTPGATFPANITLKIFDTTGHLLTTDNQTFNVAYRPSASPTLCASGPNWTHNSNYLNDGSQWYDSTDGNCYYGITQDVTFNSFSGSPVTLPSTVIYDISYNSSASVPMNSLNVEMSNEATNVSVGSDANPGYVYLASTGAAIGPSGQITCTTPAPFGEYSTAAGNSNGCGAQVPDSNNTPPPAPEIADIPQVQFNATAGGSVPLYPGGPGQPVDFSITNGGPSSAYVQSVSIAVDQASLPGGCAASWFTVVQPSTPMNDTVPAGQTTNYQPSGAVVSLQNLPINQDACQGATFTLKFTSN